MPKAKKVIKEEVKEEVKKEVKKEIKIDALTPQEKEIVKDIMEKGSVTVVLPNGTKRSYSYSEHGAVWKVLAKNYKEANDGEFV